MKLLGNPPQTAPGSRFHYSNAGFTIAGVIAEITTDTPWETLIENEVFTPLKLQSAGFGVPRDTHDKLEQPRGHRTSWGITKSNREDNTPIIGPAGTIHMQMEDLLRYANEHLQGRKGNGLLLKKQTYEALHTPNLNNYAFGWVVTEGLDWASGPVIWHNGSNTSWYTMLAMFPGLNTVMVVNSNHGQIKLAEKAAWKIIKQMALAVQNNQTTAQMVHYISTGKKAVDIDHYRWQKHCRGLFRLPTAA